MKYAPNITGATRILGIIGDPIRQVRAPEVWTALFAYNKIDAVCIPMQVAAADVAALVKSARTLMNYIGLIVTIPHKPAALTCTDHPTERARLVGAANVLRPAAQGGWEGDILDGVGFVSGLLAQGQKVAGRRALVVGSGGVGSAIACAIAAAGAAEVAVSDVAPARAEALAQRIARTGVRSYASAAKADGFDLIVNASPMGMKPGDPISIDCTNLQSSALVGDVVVHPRITPLLAKAQERGCFVQPGTVMMEHQLTEMAAYLGFAGGDWSPETVDKVMSEG